MADSVDGSPTKSFFINMLTRDIALNDAILDLLDNCLDGVVRIKGGDNKNADREYYNDFWAKISISQDSFEIKDNCGGIPRDVAEAKAFRMGREAGSDNNLPTVGIYGIGMKRAIFKIGKQAVILSNHKDSRFAVNIPEDWADRKEWNFPIVEGTVNDNENEEKGTTITIKQLTEGVYEQWSPNYIESYIVDLISSIKNSYSLIIEKGFKIYINGKEVSGLPVQLLAAKSGGGMLPYMFKKEYGEVSVKLIIGFYAPPPTDEEIEESNESRRSSSEAGWTVVCNDRVVLYNDKSHLTGWGEAGVPQYHMQFIGIKGIVVFESNNPEKLPMTTTKRGIDLSSPIYADIKNRMREGLKTFTDHTNRWKGKNDEDPFSSEDVESIPYSSLFEETEINKKKGVNFKNTDGGFKFRPNLPKPSKNDKYKTIKFMKSEEDITIVRAFLYDDPTIEIKPSKIGEECFDRTLKEASKSK
jgi:hypothetical protein